MVSSRHTSVVLLFYTLSTPCLAICYQPEAVAGIVSATFVMTSVIAVLIITAVWYQRRRRKDKTNGNNPPADPGPPGQFAFDNPYFREHDEDDADGTAPEKGGKNSSKGNAMSLFAFKHSDMSVKGKKYKGTKGHGFNTMFSTGKRQRAMDDSCLAVEPERTIVSLKGHDFTGLGFNICGNMRDGILVKDVLHRGPASESGKIKAGDRIISVTVSFTSMVYEDALTILSYASPYDVQLELERPTDQSRGIEPSTPGKRLGSSSFSGNGQRLFHPLYRSQSIDDLTQIGKDTFPGHGFGPRRSQSVGVAAHKLAFHFKSADGSSEEKSSPSTVAVSTTGSLNERMLACVMMDGGLKRCGPMWEKKFEDSLESDDVPDGNPTSPAGNKPRSSSSKKKNLSKPASEQNSSSGKARTTSSESEKSDDSSSSNPLSLNGRNDAEKEDDSSKRRAPLPPSSSTNHAVSIKTKAQVHHHGFPKQSSGQQNGVHSSESTNPSHWGANHNQSTESSGSLSDHESSNGFRPRLDGNYSSVSVRSPRNGCRNGQNCGECDSDLSGDSLDQSGNKHKTRASQRHATSPHSKMEEAVNDACVLADRDASQHSSYVDSRGLQHKLDYDGSSSDDKSPTVDENSFHQWEYRNSWNNLEKKHDPSHDLQSATTTSAPAVGRESRSEKSFMHGPASPKFPSKNGKIKREITDPLDAANKDSMSSSGAKKSNKTQKTFQADHAINNNGLPTDYGHQYSVGHPHSQNSTYFHTRDNGLPLSSVVVSSAHPVVKYPEKKQDSSIHSRAAPNPQKEVIEISQHELDGVMMSHRQFLMKQANAGGIYGNPNSTRQRTNMDFEAWKFVGDSKREAGRPANGSAVHASVYQRAGNQTVFDSPGGRQVLMKKETDVSSHNAKVPESGFAKSVIISTFDNSSGRSSLRLTSMDMPPSYLDHK